MLVTINLDPDVETGLTLQAEKRGMPLNELLREIVAREAANLTTSVQRTAMEKAQAFARWAQNHRSTPPLSEEAVSRASLIREAL